VKRPAARDAATSARLGKIRQKGTKVELLVAEALRSQGIGYRKNVRSLPGSPDFANRKGKWAIFVNGCFWHHHKGCGRATIPKSNDAFWMEKFRDNRKRDARAVAALRKLGFKVLLLWECEVEGRLSSLGQILEAGRIDPR